MVYLLGNENSYSFCLCFDFPKSNRLPWYVREVLHVFKYWLVAVIIESFIVCLAYLVINVNLYVTIWYQ